MEGTLCTSKHTLAASANIFLLLLRCCSRDFMHTMEYKRVLATRSTCLDESRAIVICFGRDVVVKGPHMHAFYHLTMLVWEHPISLQRCCSRIFVRTINCNNILPMSWTFVKKPWAIVTCFAQDMVRSFHSYWIQVADCCILSASPVRLQRCCLRDVMRTINCNHIIFISWTVIKKSCSIMMRVSWDVALEEMPCLEPAAHWQKHRWWENTNPLQPRRLWGYPSVPF
jgi:hypothetical protein